MLGGGGTPAGRSRFTLVFTCVGVYPRHPVDPGVPPSTPINTSSNHLRNLSNILDVQYCTFLEDVQNLNVSYLKCA